MEQFDERVDFWTSTHKGRSFHPPPPSGGAAASSDVQKDDSQVGRDMVGRRKLQRRHRRCIRVAVAQKCGTGRSGENTQGEMTSSAGLMPTGARGNYLPEAPYIRETKTL